MYVCRICKKKIKTKELNQTFHFTLGIMESDKFIGDKSIYCHVKCLNKKDPKQPHLSALISQKS